MENRSTEPPRSRYEKLPPMAGEDRDIWTDEFEREIRERQTRLAEYPDAELAAALEDSNARVLYYHRPLADYLDATVKEAAERLRQRDCDTSALESALNDAFDLLVDLGGSLDAAIAARVLGRGQRVAEMQSLRSRKFLSEVVKRYPWLSGEKRRSEFFALAKQVEGTTPSLGLPRCDAREGDGSGYQCEKLAGHEERGEGGHACPQALDRFLELHAERRGVPCNRLVADAGLCLLPCPRCGLAQCQTLRGKYWVRCNCRTVDSPLPTHRALFVAPEADTVLAAVSAWNEFFADLISPPKTSGGTP